MVRGPCPPERDRSGRPGGGGSGQDRPASPTTSRWHGCCIKPRPLEVNLFKRIVVPVDQSQLVSRELHAALAVAQSSDAEIYVLRINPTPANLDEAELDLNIIEDETRHLLAEILREVGSGLPLERIHPEIRSGPVVGTIIEAAEELQADLIVVGSHGRHRFLEMLTGNTAEQLVNKTSASVLVVKPEGFPFLSE